ncbi:uncharacterized protein LOC118435151 [Folsomia candida]|nr:uncharacterized protein LOC118435151 [Folsomia candida]XP_035706510.1 uncharacterized protein LOC118435151 [Folsomia candida]
MEARYMTDLEWRICHAVNIYLYRNGKDGEAPILVHIPPAKKKNMRSVMNVIQERVKFPVGFAAYLYKMDGKRVRHPCEMEMYNNYVVASNYDKYFKCAQYGRKRSPLLVLNRESKHIRVLRQQNQNYYEWSLKKKAVGEERPQFIYPTFYTNENARAQDLPVGQMGNFVPPGGVMPNACCPPQRPGEGQQAPSGYQGSQPTPTSGFHPPPFNNPSAMPMFPSSGPPPLPPKQYAVNPCLVQGDQSGQDAMKSLQEFSGFRCEEKIMEQNSSHLWSKHAQYGHRKIERKPKLRESDVLNANVIAELDSKPNLDEYASDSSRHSGNSFTESILDTDCLGGKYQEMLKQFKRKLKKQALLELQSSYSSMQLCRSRSRHRYKPKKTSRPAMTNMHRSSCILETEDDDDDEQIIVLPPPPIEFRDGIIPRRGTFYSYNPQQHL